MNVINGDHIDNLGIDIFLEVISFLDTASLVRCTEVSKAWRSFLLNPFASGVTAIRSFCPHDVQSSHFPSLRLWFERITTLIAASSGLHELRTQEGIIPDTTALKLVTCSAGNLVWLELHLLPPGSTRAPVDTTGGGDWNVELAQDNLNDAVNSILSACPNLLHLTLSAPYEQVEMITEVYCCRFVVPRNFSDSRKPKLRSLRLFDLKPRYDIHFFHLVEHLETLVIAGEGLQLDTEGDICSPASLRVLLRYLERGDNIRMLEIEQPLCGKGQGAPSIFAALSEGLVTLDEVDRRWETERAAQLALDEGIIGSLIYDAEGNEHGQPRNVILAHLEKLRVVSGINMISDRISPILVRRNRELSRIQAPRLEDLFIDCAQLQRPLMSLISSFSPPSRLRRLTLQRPDAEMLVEDMLGFLCSVPTVEELSFIFTYTDGGYFTNQKLFDFRSLLSALSTVPVRRAGNGLEVTCDLPRLTKLHLVDEEETTGTDRVRFIRARKKMHRAWLKDGSGVAPCLPIETLSLYSGYLSPYKVLRPEVVKWLRAHLLSFNEERKNLERPKTREEYTIPRSGRLLGEREEMGGGRGDTPEMDGEQSTDEDESDGDDFEEY